MQPLKILAGALMLAGMSTPVLADHHTEMLSAEQKAMYNGWSATQRTTYDGWPMEAQTYYWTLGDMERGIWWNSLDDAQRVQIVSMTPAQRTAAWTSIRNQVNSANNATSSNASATARANSNAAVSGNITFRSNAVMQDIPAPHNGEYPPCRNGVREDNCINPREAGLNYGNRPLNYWPGKPASTMDDN